jgi:hypothetical protein
MGRHVPARAEADPATSSPTDPAGCGRLALPQHVHERQPVTSSSWATSRLEVKSLTRHVRIELEDEDADLSSAILLIRMGSTDVHVIEWAAQCLPPEHLAVLRSAIEAAE